MRLFILFRPCIFVLLCWRILNAPVFSQTGGPDSAAAREYFTEVRVACQKDHGSLWGIDLYGPILFVDRDTRAITANQQDREQKLSPSGNGLYLGTLPKEINISNTALDWAGVRWTMVALPLPEDKNRRNALIVHELFHRVQDKLGFPMTGPSNNHLDTKNARIWIQLEWRALANALSNSGSERKKGIEDALYFRAYRRELFHTAMIEERALEMHEGLAEYTGMKIGIATDAERIQYTLRKLDETSKNKSFVRSFAYASGPAYGLLCDLSRKKWIPRLKKEREFGAVIQKLYAITMKGNIGKAAMERSTVYGADSIIAAETNIERDKRTMIAGFRSRYINGNVLSIPLRNMNMQFDPSNIQPFDTLGTVYPTIRITDDWGILTVTNGALMNPTFQKITLPAPASKDSLRGDGWTLDLKKGWNLIPDSRNGDFILNQSH